MCIRDSYPPSVKYGDAEIKWELVLEIDLGSGMLAKMTYPLNVSFHQTKREKQKP